ncbi:MAG: HAMP domain-containing histidine kinase [Bacteroidales bacterium]|nr:HAMP domain-containing histidine kinase [Bacteroidales bacterium]
MSIISQFRLFLVAFVTVFISVSFSAYAEDKEGMSDACYEYYLKATDAFGTPAFNSLNEKLLRAATENNDPYAELQYYVLNLRYLCRGSSTQQVMNAAEQVWEKSKALESEKYYFNAYSRVALYLTDVDPNEELLINLMSKMLGEAQEMDSQYGVYEANRYLSILYRRRNELLASRKYAIAAYKIYINTDDPFVRSESIIIRTLIDCSETYPPKSDSIRFFLDEARRLSMVEIDTMRCNYADSKFYAIERDVDKYEYYKQQTRKSDRYYKRYYPEGEDLYTAADAAFAGDWETFQAHADKLNSQADLKFLCEFTEAFGNFELTARYSRKMIELFIEYISDNGKGLLDELSVKLGNIQLSTELHDTTHRLMNARTAVYIVSGLLFLVILISFIVYVIKSRVHERKNQQIIKELEAARDEAQRANELKTSFVHNMSHEIRTPLNALVGFSQLLSLPDGYLTEDEKQDYASYITNNSSLLTMLIDDILSTADIEAGNYKLNFAMADCFKICKYAGKTAEIRVQPGVDLRYYMDIPDGFEVYSDPSRIQQVLINMITNACKNTDSGSITIGCTTKEVPGYVTFFVADTGRGVPPEKAEVIFERFIKLDQFKQGTGLGLSICKLIAKLLHGDIYLDKTYTSGGARFVFNIPIEFKK